METFSHGHDGAVDRYRLMAKEVQRRRRRRGDAAQEADRPPQRHQGDVRPCASAGGPPGEWARQPDARDPNGPVMAQVPQGDEVPLPSRRLGRPARPHGHSGMNMFMEHRMTARKQSAIEGVGVSSAEYGESNEDSASKGSAEADEPAPCAQPVAQPRLAVPSGLEQDQSGLTTLMVRGIPVTCTILTLLAWWPNYGNYDFLYLPYSFELQRNQSYAFINFTNPAAAATFRDQWQKQRLPHARKPLVISFADVQGRDANLLQFMSTSFSRHYSKYSECQPVVFEDGDIMPLALALGLALGKVDARKQRERSRFA